MSQRSEAAGNIYDLGYRHYDGVRLGRRQALLSLYFYSLRGAFGLGRGTGSKIIPVAIVLLAAAPTFGQLAIAAISPIDASVIRPENYFDFIQVTLAIFCATVAPELFARDQRMRTLPLYFARGLKRSDYTLAKLAALTTALLFITFLPQFVLFIGNGLAGSDLGGYVQDHWLELPQVIASGVLIAVFFACISAAIGSQTPRRAYSTVAIIAVLILTSIVAGVIAATMSGVVVKIVMLLVPFEAATGVTRWIFNASVQPETNLGQSGLDLWLCFPAVLIITAIAGYLTFRRFEKVAA
jgi:ABC-2 type transport system permease protein